MRGKESKYPNKYPRNITKEERRYDCDIVWHYESAKEADRDKRLTCVCVCEQRMYMKALSKYQFETATTI